MSALAFLGVAVVVSVIGSLIVLARNRSPRSIDHGIDDFAQRMRALSPDDRATDPTATGRPATRGPAADEPATDRDLT